MVKEYIFEKVSLNIFLFVFKQIRSDNNNNAVPLFNMHKNIFDDKRGLLPKATVRLMLLLLLCNLFFNAHHAMYVSKIEPGNCKRQFIHRDASNLILC